MNPFLQLGSMADERLERLGLSVTQGGEPTFVPEQHHHSEWTFTALGPEKLGYARRLASLLAAKLLPGAVPILSSGKLYPGEALPRWKLGLYAVSGAPLWNNLKWIKLSSEGDPAGDRTMAQSLIGDVASALGIDKDPLPAYENIDGWMRLEAGVGGAASLPRFSRRDMSFLPGASWSEEEARIWTERCQPVGWVLPLACEQDRWIQPAWEWDGDPDLVLLQGDSPIGLRLPLGSIRCRQPKCALTVEVRDGEIKLFLPPLPGLDQFRLLLTALESVLERGDYPPISLEGYPPSFPEAIRSMALVADPGVLEINLPPCGRFKDLHHTLDVLFQSAESCGLRGYRTNPAGYRQGSGGGAHIMLGGPTLEKNPFVQCPHLLPSFLRFIQNHPCLSYMFSGAFIGPSSQATRLDETLPGMLPELELALGSIEALSAPADPEMIDRILRNLLHDWHGNPHRSEICVDKFFYPFTSDGRLGLVEFRAIEMLPSAEMLIGVHALIRALAAAFAEQPYTRPLIHWGLDLHDRFLLPYYLRQDFESVLAFLRERGFAVASECFNPQFEFRFPILAEEHLLGAHIVIRQALELWPVMGAQPGPGGSTSRPVDTSTDRMQIAVQAEEEKALPVMLVNGIRLPLHRPAPDAKVLLCGLRYRQFNNSLGLQPQVPAHTPLTFDLIEPDAHTVLARYQYQGPRGILNPEGNIGGLTPLPVPEGTTAVIRQWDPDLRGRCTVDLRMLA